MSYKVIPTGRFQKDLKRAEKRGLKLNLLSDVIKILASGEPLPPKYKDHPLTGNYEGCRECHIQPDSISFRRWFPKTCECPLRHR